MSSYATYLHVSDLQVGEVVIMGHDPRDSSLQWLRSPGLAPPHLELVDCTVSALTRLPDTATESKLSQRNDGTMVYEMGQPDLYTLRLLHNGKGWKVEVRANAAVHRLPAHFTRCGGCNELWPCREERLDRAAHRLTAGLDSSCAHCGKPIGGAWSESFFDGVTRRRYHTAQKYRGPDGRRCKDALVLAKASPPS